MHNGPLLVNCLKCVSYVHFFTQRNAQYDPIGLLIIWFLKSLANAQCESNLCHVYLVLTLLCIQDLDAPYFLSDGSLLFLVLPILQ